MSYVVLVVLIWGCKCWQKPKSRPKTAASAWVKIQEVAPFLHQWNINRSHKVTCLSSSVFALQSEILCHFSIMDWSTIEHIPHTCILLLAYTLVISASCNFGHLLLTTFTYAYEYKAMHTYTKVAMYIGHGQCVWLQWTTKKNTLWQLYTVGRILNA